MGAEGPSPASLDLSPRIQPQTKDFPIPWLLCLVCIVNLYFSRTCYASISIKVKLTDNRAIEGKGYPRENWGQSPARGCGLFFLFGFFLRWGSYSI